MRAFVGWPDVISGSTIEEVFNRTRLLIDLDEATDELSPPSVLVVMGVPRAAVEAPLDPDEVATVARLGELMTDVIGEAGSIYETRTTEVCALLDGTEAELAGLLDAIGEELACTAGPGSSVSLGFVALPEGAPDAITALTIVDRRLRIGAGIERSLPAL